MNNFSETKVVIKYKLDTPNGLCVDWIANNLYWTDNEYKVITTALTVITKTIDKLRYMCLNFCYR